MTATPLPDVVAATIDDFVARYGREFDFYDQAAHLAAVRLDAALRASAIRAIVTARAKRPDRLAEKLRQRAATKAYASHFAIRDDIPDLAGVRVALYFPGTRLDANRIVANLFDATEPPREFPNSNPVVAPASTGYARRFPGYGATHHRVRFRSDTLAGSDARFGGARLEVQVASLLMHAWSEVEHDLVYKPLTGALSDDELAILDELNGLVLAGEIALERLQTAGRRRVEGAADRAFANVYELGAILTEHARRHWNKDAGEATMGRVDDLLALLQRVGEARPAKLAQYLKDLDPNIEKRPIADQVVDRVLGANEDRYKAFSEIRAGHYVAQPIAHRLGEFVHLWLQIEAWLNERLARDGVHVRSLIPIELVREAERRQIIDAGLAARLNKLRGERNRIVHDAAYAEANVATAGAEAKLILEELAPR